MNNRKGFTLVELMIATGIMVPALGMLIYGIIQYSALTQTSRNIDIALNAAQQKIEEIAASDLNLIMNFHNQTFDVAGLTPDPAAGSVGSVTVAELTIGELYEVQATIRWQQRAGRQMLRTLRTTLLNK